VPRATATLIGGRRPPATSVPHVTSTINFSFSPAILPLGDPKVGNIKVDPQDQNLWYVSSSKGLYITRDGGATWTLTKEIVPWAMTLSLQDSSRVYVGIRETLHASVDKGRTWQVLRQFDAGTTIRSIHASRDGTLMVGLHWADFRKPTGNPEGVYLSRDRGATWQLSAFGTPHRGLIVWAVHQNPRDGTLYASTEISDHPQPYKPPFFRSRDGGKTWQETGGLDDWHALSIQVRPTDGYLYVLTEGRGLFGSADHGDHWTLFPTNIVGHILLDPNYPHRLFGNGAANALGQNGGIYLSLNGGKSSEQFGFEGKQVYGIALNGDSTMLYLTVRDTGIFTARIPATAK
jgi:photosystem II stability/assembly factor-like uncharacterized protein